MRAEKHRSGIVDLLIILFGVSSWVAVNGLWVELPVLVNTLPEAWKLSSYIVITTQAANLGPVLFGAARRIVSQKVLEVPSIHVSLAIVIGASALMSVFWDATTNLAGQLHSTALLVLTFLVAFVDCTSSLLYLPFIANFKEQYVISYLIGAGLSGPIPGVLALAQGVGGYAECKNVSLTNVTDCGNLTYYEVQPFYPPPRFSPTVFFAVLCVQMVASWIAFVLLNTLTQAKRELVSAISLPVSRPSNPAVEDNFQSSITSSVEKSTSSELSFLVGRPRLSANENIVLLSIQAFLSATHNGLLLSIQTYSCLPYGSLAFHLTVTLSSFANPICCFLAMFVNFVSVRLVEWLAVIIAFFASYILATALLSPEPPLVDIALGAYLVVISWVAVSGVVAFTKAGIASMLRRDGGQTALYHCGVVTQIGSAVGAIIAFTLIQCTALFKSYSPCR